MHETRGDSGRRGFTTFAYHHDSAVVAIADHGGWKRGSPVLIGYIEDVERWQNNPLHGIGL